MQNEAPTAVVGSNPSLGKIFLYGRGVLISYPTVQSSLNQSQQTKHLEEMESSNQVIQYQYRNTTHDLQGINEYQHQSMHDLHGINADHPLLVNFRKRHPVSFSLTPNSMHSGI